METVGTVLISIVFVAVVIGLPAMLIWVFVSDSREVKARNLAYSQAIERVIKTLIDQGWVEWSWGTSFSENGDRGIMLCYSEAFYEKYTTLYFKDADDFTQVEEGWRILRFINRSSALIDKDALPADHPRGEKMDIAVVTYYDRPQTIYVKVSL